VVGLLAVLVLGGAGTAASYDATGSTTRRRYLPVTIKSGKRLTTSPSVRDRRRADARGDRRTYPTLAALEAANNRGAKTRVVNAVVAIPRGALCSDKIRRTTREQCLASDVAVTAIGSRGAHVLLISNDRSQLLPNMRRGLAQAVCELQPNYTDSLAKLSAICEMTKQFVKDN
jgi:hypothetical protein